MKTACFKFSLDRGFGHVDFAKSLASHELKGNQDTGFELTAISPRRITGTFYSKRVRRLNLTTFSGDIETVSRDSIERVDFHIDLIRGLLVVIDPRLERARFVSRLITCARFRVTLEPFYNNVSQFVAILAASDCTYEVLQVVLTEVPLSKGVKARILAMGALPEEALTGKVGGLQGRISRFDIKLEADGKKYPEQELRVYTEGRIEFPKAKDKKIAMLCYSRLKLT